MRSTCRSVVGVADRLPCATRAVLRCLVGCAACGGDASAPPPRAAAIHPLRPVPVASAPAAAAPASAAPLSETSASATPAASASPRYTGPSHLPDLPPANLVGPCVPEKPISIGTSDAPWNEDPSPTIAATTTGMMVVWESKRGKTLHARALDASGAPVAEESTIALPGAGKRMIAPLVDGRYAVLTISDSRDGYAIGSVAMVVTLDEKGGLVGQPSFAGGPVAAGTPVAPVVTPLGAAAFFEGIDGNAVIVASFVPDGPAKASAEAIPAADIGLLEDVHVLMGADGRFIEAAAVKDDLVVHTQGGGRSAFGKLEGENYFTLDYVLDEQGVLVGAASYRSGDTIPGYRFPPGADRPAATPLPRSLFGPGSMHEYSLAPASGQGGGISLWRHGQKYGSTPIATGPIDPYYSDLAWSGQKFVAAYQLRQGDGWTIYTRALGCSAG